MFEKVSILGKDPMSATNEDFEKKAGIVSMLQTTDKNEASDELHLIDKSKL